ncbi:hypothetical protein Tco_1350264 [Tanacetum coccineum]
MKNNQIIIFTKPLTNTDDLSEMDLKLRLMNIIHLNKSNETHTTHQQLYDTLYDLITLDQEALNALDSELSFHKQAHNNQDLSNNRDKEAKSNHLEDELTIADLEGAGLERLKQQYPNDVELEYHVDQLKAAVLSEAK